MRAGTELLSVVQMKGPFKASCICTGKPKVGVAMGEVVAVFCIKATRRRNQQRR